MSQTKSFTHNINSTGTAGIIVCYCNEPAPLRTSTTNTNPNRDFYCCGKDRGDEDRCKFFKWKDELDRQAQLPPSTPAMSQTSAEPSPSQRLRAEAARGSTTPNSKKRGRSPQFSQGAPSRRLADIEAALSQHAAEVDAAKQKRLADSPTHPSSSGRHQTEGSDDDDTFFSVTSSPPRSTTGTHYHIHLPPPETPSSYDSPRSPKRQRLDHEGSRNNMLMTPPGTDRTAAWNGFAVGPPESPLKGKGKDRDDEPSMSQWQGTQANEDNPSHERAASLRGRSHTTSASFPSPSHSLPTTTETPESIKTLLSDLTSTLPAYIAKLERKQIASEKSNEAKLRKIEELERDNGLLRNKIRVLEETVSALKARRPLV